MKSKLIITLLFFAVLSCKKAEAESSSDLAISMAKLPPKKEIAEVGSNSAFTNDEKKIIEQKIIRNGNLRFETDNLESTYEQIKTAVKKGKAFIQNDSEGKDYSSIYRRITVRIPSENFDSFIKDFSTGVAYFDNKEISSQDVTEEYIDIDARLKTKKKLENRYLELLAKATKMSEMLAIEAQLSAIREEIEAKEGQLRYMQNQVSLSTVTIEFYKTIAQESGVTISYGAKVWNAFKSGFYGISSFFLGLLEIWPFIIIAIALFYFIRKRFKKKNK
ncbi:DUF4349 domain-containing protein [Flavobacterium gilvum]|uniref:DUF4349 domain-containing protein n=1 Tax=Flavobacterium gilvum TaxID=1492737 RepID=A0AAC9I3J7_9FLAO|nr:DUF4349 domain-containing protein [Flavobacterium gilvum]AOW08872.1 hypothetical protein EM308_04775 [Flavobacterium gilvum]KFC60951.1 hypothetical protein FEM08_02620 [Flavobacterium gilvum]